MRPKKKNKPFSPTPQKRNFGFGRTPGYAGKQALRRHFRDGHGQTVNTYHQRWLNFVRWMQSEHGIRDIRDFTKEHFTEYAQAMASAVAFGDRSKKFATDQISSVNITFKAVHGNDRMRLIPSAFLKSVTAGTGDAESSE